MQGLRQRVARSYNGMVIEFLVFLQCRDQLVCLLLVITLHMLPCLYNTSHLGYCVSEDLNIDSSITVHQHLWNWF